MGSCKRNSPRPPSVFPRGANCSHGLLGHRFLPSVLPFTAERSGCTSRFPSTRYWGIAAVPKASSIREIAFAPSRRSVFSALPYGPPYSRRSLGETSARRRGTFTGQIHLPFCEGETTRHLSSIRRPFPLGEPYDAIGRVRMTNPTLPHTPELGVSLRPKRDSSLADPSWPLRHRQLPFDAGCVPRTLRVRDGLSERARTRPGRIWEDSVFHDIIFLHRLRLSKRILRLTRTAATRRRFPFPYAPAISISAGPL